MYVIHGPESHWESTSSAADPRQGSNTQIVEFNNNFVTLVSKCSFDASLYKFIDDWLTGYQIPNVQHSLHRVDEAHSQA